MPLSSLASVSLVVICVGTASAAASSKQKVTLTRQLDSLGGSGDTTCPSGEISFSFGGDLEASCVPNVLELYDEVSVPSVDEYIVGQDKFCLNGGMQGRGLGEVPDSCYGEYSVWSPIACYKPCIDGFSTDGGLLCSQNCAEGSTSDGELCKHKKDAVVPGFCLGDFPNFHDGKCYKSGVEHLVKAPGGECPPWYNDAGSSCWRATPIDVIDVKLKKECPADYDLKGPNCEGQSVPVSCPDGYSLRGLLCALNVPKPLPGPSTLELTTYPREGKVRSCGFGEEYNNGLCYPKCTSGSKGVGSVCWPSCPKGTVECGMGCAKNSQSCAAYTVNKSATPFWSLVYSILSIATSGASDDLSEAASTAVSATLGEAGADEGLMVSILYSHARSVDINMLKRALTKTDDFLERITRNLLLRNPPASPAFKECLKHYNGLQYCLPTEDAAVIENDSWRLKNCLTHGDTRTCLSNENWISLGKQIAKVAYTLHVSVERVLDPNSRPVDVAEAVRSTLDVGTGFDPAGLAVLGALYSYPTCVLSGRNQGSSDASGASSGYSSTQSVNTSTYIGVAVGIVGLVSLVALAGYGTVTGGLGWTKLSGNIPAKLSQQQMEEADVEAEDRDEENKQLNGEEREICSKILSI